MANLSETLARVTKEKLKKYDNLRSGVEMCAFWDFIVLTATDEDQAGSYMKQLEVKKANNEIPNCCKYFVFPDPPGPKIGNGGATMFALTKLEELEGTKLDQAKVLLIHAGGFSKRLPNVSVIGKIFAALPLGDPVYTMLEMKIASYIDFPEKMSPGVFVTCADDIELLDVEGDLSFTKPGFTALGHPSSLEIGTTHGVFVLDKESKATQSSSKDAPACVVAGCSRFLHKPSVATMKEKGALVGDDCVYTDSAYYCCRKTAMLLMHFYKDNKPLTCEIDAYGDFLQALGPESTDEYTRDAENVIVEDDSLAKTRLKLYQYLNKIPLNVVLCNVSKFYHIGTIPEFLFHYCADPFFRSELGCSREAFTSYRSSSSDCKTLELVECTAIHSLLSPETFIGAKTVVEYSDLGPDVIVGSDCVVSNVRINEAATIPAQTFLHTTCTKDGYVTIVYGTSEDLKAKAKFKNVGAELTYCNVSFAEVFKRLNCTAKTFWDDENASCTLWSAKIFPCFPTERESIHYAINTAAVINGDINAKLEIPIGDCNLMAMADILKAKDLSTILSARDALRTRILAARKANAGSSLGSYVSGIPVVPVVLALVAVIIAFKAKQILDRV